LIIPIKTGVVVKPELLRDYRVMNEITNKPKFTEDRTMTKTSFSVINDNDLNLACGGAASKEYTLAGYSQSDDGSSNVFDTGSVSVNPEDDPRMPIRL
jgi:hypothetical protein